MSPGDLNKIVAFLEVFQEAPKQVSEPAEGNVDKIINFLAVFGESHEVMLSPLGSDQMGGGSDESSLGNYVDKMLWG